MAVFARFMVIRSFVRWQRRRSATLTPSSDRTIVETFDVEDALFNIRQDGFYSGLRLCQQALDELLSFCQTSPCFADGTSDRVYPLGDRGTAEQETIRSCRRAMYRLPLRSSPHLRALAFDRQLLELARHYLGTEPVLSGASVWWSFAGPADGEQQRQAGQAFHYDIDGFASLAFFFYLTDVSPSNGPHVFVRGTHVKKFWRHTFCIFKRRSDSEINKTYGVERQVLLCGPAGSGFAADIFGFHKGLHPENGDRLIVQIRYASKDYGTTRDL